MFGRARATPTINPTMNEISINMTMVSVIWHLLPDSPGESEGPIALYINRRENLEHLKWMTSTVQISRHKRRGQSAGGSRKSTPNVYDKMLSFDQFCALL